MLCIFNNMSFISFFFINKTIKKHKNILHCTFRKTKGREMFYLFVGLLFFKKNN